MLKIGCFPQDTKKTETCRHERKKKEGKRNCGRKREKRTCTTSSTTSPQTHLKSTPEVPHLHPTRLPARRFASAFFFFFFSRIHADLAQFTPNWSDSAKIELYRPYRVVSAIGRYGRNMLETAEIGLESSRNSRNSHLRGIVICFLPSSFFVL